MLGPRMVVVPPQLRVSRLTAGQGDRDRSQQPLSRPHVCSRRALFLCLLQDFAGPLLVWLCVLGHSAAGDAVGPAGA